MTDDELEKQLEAQWSALLEYEENCFLRCAELDRENPEKTGKKAEAVRERWGVTNAIVMLFVQTRAQFDHELQPFPAYTLDRLANVAEELSKGNLPSFVADAAKAGRPLWRKERHHIAYGVLYIEAARRGEIEDNAPNKTVRQAYNVTKQAVQNWMKRRDEICVGVPHNYLSSENLHKKMLECAKIYTIILAYPVNTHTH
jgi:hypothetical protein